MQLQSIITEENPNPVIILSRFGRVVYANIPGMDLMEHLDLNIGDRVLRVLWEKAKSSLAEGQFMLPLMDNNYKWSVRTLQNGFVYLVAKKVEEMNLLFSRM